MPKNVALGATGMLIGAFTGQLSFAFAFGTALWNTLQYRHVMPKACKERCEPMFKIQECSTSAIITL